MQAILKFSDGFVRLMDVHCWEDPKGPDGDEVPGVLIIRHFDKRVTMKFQEFINGRRGKRAEYVECDFFERK